MLSTYLRPCNFNMLFYNQSLRLKLLAIHFQNLDCFLLVMSCQKLNFFRASLGVTITEGHLKNYSLKSSSLRLR